MMFVLTACGDTTSPQKVENGNQAASTNQKEANKSNGDKEEENNPKEAQTFKIGDTIKMGELIITVNSVRTDKGQEFIKPKEGHIFYLVDATIENKSTDSTTISSLMMFKLTDNDGYNYNITMGPETKGQLDGELGAGRKMRGELAFEIPKDSKGLELIFEPNIFGFGQAIIKLDR